MKKNFLNKTVISFYMIISINCAYAQVKSSSFNFTLNLLLNSNTPIINIAEAAKGLNNYLFLDAREYKEYKVSHIQNARFAGDKGFNLNQLTDLQKNKPIVVYCSIGKRSEDITVKMIKAGFTNVKNLYGGIFEWVNQGHPVYKINNTITDSVHAYSHFWGKWLNNGVKVYD